MNPADLQIDDDVVEVGVADFRTPVDGSEDGQAGFRLPKSLGGNGHEVVLGIQEADKELCDSYHNNNIFFSFLFQFPASQES